MPHDIDEYITKLENTWNSESDYQKKIKIGSDFFNFRAEGKNTNDKSYIKNQNADLLPPNFDKNKINITIFNSSEDEFFSIGPEWKKYFETQTEGIIYICNKIKDLSNYNIYLRIHPNLSSVKADFVNEMYDLERV